MRILLIHQNFPGQFRSLTSHLQGRGHDLIAICSHDRPVYPDIRVIRYQAPADLPIPMSLGQQIWHCGLARAESVAKICFSLHQQGWMPDRILAHSGWGETLALHLIYEGVPLILWPELWVLPLHGGHGVDNQLPPPNLDAFLTQLGRNSLTRVALDYASCWVMPTIHQASSLPKLFQDHRLNIIHEGIDCELCRPDSEVSYCVRNINIDSSVPTITFVNRNLERLRGFDQFMRSIPALQSAFPNLRFIIVGDSEKGYGSSHSSGRSLREVMVEELHCDIDFEKIHFLGRIPHSQLIGILQCSWVHVYLSYPFVLGWSLLEAMACGCAIVGSQGMPVEEVITHDKEGLLVPLDDPISLANSVLSILSNSLLRARLGNSARLRALDYDKLITLPKLTDLIESTL